MRIFYSAQSTPNETALPHSRLWYVNLCLPLKDLGHDIIPFETEYLHAGYDLDPYLPEHQALIAQRRPQFSEDLLQAVKTAHRHAPIDLFFSYFASAHVESDAIREIGKMGITTMNWYCNASYQFHLVRDLAPAYQYCLVPEKFRLEDYRRAGAQPIYCQEAANPNVYRPYELPVEYQATFVGQRYGNRPAYIQALVDAGIDVRVWGPYWETGVEPMYGWRQLRQGIANVLRLRQSPWLTNGAGRYGGALSDEALIQMYSRSKISLGFSSVANVELGIKQVRLRDFEAPMSGAFYMVEYFEDLKECFVPEKEIVCFASERELIDKVKYYTTHEDERKRIRQAGLMRARSEHTWHQRFQQIFRSIGMA
jgi:spore maturation protein CgeB